MSSGRFRFLTERDGQDLTEYTLLLALIVLLTAGAFMAAGWSVGDVWETSESNLTAANSIAAGADSGSGSGSTTTPQEPGGSESRRHRRRHGHH